MKEKINNPNSLNSAKVLFYGRTLQEYVKMFDLDLSVCKGYKILDCPAGPASFVAEAHQLGIDVVGCDPLYNNELNTLLEDGKQDIDKTIEILSQFAQVLSQKFYSSLDNIKEYATSALQKFVEDYPAGRTEKRYLQGQLPNLPFKDETFDLVLSGNFLFVYSKVAIPTLENLDYQFHLDAVLELLRVCKGEVRIFPITFKGSQLNEYAEKLVSELETKGIASQIKPVDYEVSQGGNLMLCLTRT